MKQFLYNEVAVSSCISNFLFAVFFVLIVGVYTLDSFALCLLIFSCCTCTFASSM